MKLDAAILAACGTGFCMAEEPITATSAPPTITSAPTMSALRTDTTTTKRLMPRPIRNGMQVKRGQMGNAYHPFPPYSVYRNPKATSGPLRDFPTIEWGMPPKQTLFESPAPTKTPSHSDQHEEDRALGRHSDIVSSTGTPINKRGEEVRIPAPRWPIFRLPDPREDRFNQPVQALDVNDEIENPTTFVTRLSQPTASSSSSSSSIGTPINKRGELYNPVPFWPPVYPIPYSPHGEGKASSIWHEIWSPQFGPRLPWHRYWWPFNNPNSQPKAAKETSEPLPSQTNSAPRPSQTTVSRPNPDSQPEEKPRRPHWRWPLNLPWPFDFPWPKPKATHEGAPAAPQPSQTNSHPHPDSQHEDLDAPTATVTSITTATATAAAIRNTKREEATRVIPSALFYPPPPGLNEELAIYFPRPGHCVELPPHLVGGTLPGAPRPTGVKLACVLPEEAATATDVKGEDGDGVNAERELAEDEPLQVEEERPLDVSPCEPRCGKLTPNFGGDDPANALSPRWSGFPELRRPSPLVNRRRGRDAIVPYFPERVPRPRPYPFWYPPRPWVHGGWTAGVPPIPEKCDGKEAWVEWSDEGRWQWECPGEEREAKKDQPVEAEPEIRKSGPLVLES